ncbi:JAB domain-containing protein [bacterium]|nr:MAG: JAB domain-containing protein [bacterium]
MIESAIAEESVKSFTVKDLPEKERPRERLKYKGAAYLTIEELIAIIIGKGIKGESVLVMARKLLSRFGSVNNILEASLEDIQEIKGIGFAKACQISACFELARRAVKEDALEVNEKKSRGTISNPEEVAKLLKTEITNFSKEHFFVMSFDVRNKMIGIDNVSTGTLSASLVHPRETFESAIRRHAAQIIIAHNHPSGDSEPSEDDIKITRRICEAGKVMGIELMDHIIITKDDFCSLKTKGYL